VNANNQLLPLEAMFTAFYFKNPAGLKLWGRKIIFDLKLCKWQIWFSPVYIWQNYTHYNTLMVLAFILNESILTGAHGAAYLFFYQTKWQTTERNKTVLRGWRQSYSTSWRKGEEYRC